MKLKSLIPAMIVLCLLGSSVFAQGLSNPVKAKDASSTLPFQFEAQLQQVELSAATSTFPGSDQQETKLSITALMDTLPYSARVRTLQEQGRQTYSALSKASSPDEAGRLQAQLGFIQEQVTKDPSYISTMKALESRLFPQQRPHVQAGVTSNAASPFPYSELRPGDILLKEDRSSGSFFKFMDDKYARVFTHAAIYLGDLGTSKGTRRAYEALNPRQGIRITPFDGNWNTPGIHVAMGHVNSIPPISSAVTAIRAVNTFGDGMTFYHLLPPWDKRYWQLGPVKFLYCSQLVWVPFSQSGVDLDSNDPAYRVWFDANNWWDVFADGTCQAAVFPDELRASPKITWYYDQSNPR